MKFKDKTKGGYPVRLAIPEIVNSNRCSVWAVTFLGKEEFFIYDTLGHVMGEKEDNIFNLVPDNDQEAEGNSSTINAILERLTKLEEETALNKKILEQAVDVNKMGVELTTFEKIKAGLDELVEDSQRYKERRWGQCQEEMVDRPNFAVEYEARYWVRDEDGCPMLTDDYYTHSEVEEKYPNQVETIHTESYRRRT